MTKLYELQRDKNIPIYGLTDSEKSPVVIIFGHIDGMYSYCWLKDKEEQVVHLNASTELKPHKDGYEVVYE